MCSTWSKVGFSVELDHTSSLTDYQHPLPEAHLRAITQGAATWGGSASKTCEEEENHLLALIIISLNFTRLILLNDGKSWNTVLWDYSTCSGASRRAEGWWRCYSGTRGNTLPSLPGRKPLPGQRTGSSARSLSRVQGRRRRGERAGEDACGCNAETRK